MCVSAWRGNKCADTKAELRELIGVNPVADSGYTENWPDYSCLCCCNFEATAELAGMTLTYDDICDAVFTEKAKP